MIVQPLISAIIPMYNIESRISYMVTSLMEQDYTNLEVIFIDDGCSDNTAAVVSDMIKGHSLTNFKLIRHSQNCGVSTARNTGLKFSRGDYIIFLDGDDMVDKNLISSLYHKIESDCIDYDFVTCGFKTLDLLNGEIQEYPATKNNCISNMELLKQRLLNKADICAFATLFKRNFLTQNELKFFDGCEAGEDLEFLVKVICSAQKIAFIDECLYTYVQHNDMGSRKYMQKKEDCVRRYSSHTEVHFREAEYILTHTKDRTVRSLAENMLLPIGYQRRLSVCAMNDNKSGFFDMLNSKIIKTVLLSSYKSFRYKPEVFLKSLAVLCFPNIYYNKYNKKFS